MHLEITNYNFRSGSMIGGEGELKLFENMRKTRVSLHFLNWIKIL